MASALAPPAAKPNAPQSGYHCRVHERQSCELPTSCQPAASFGNPECKWSGVVRDISPGGLQLSLTRRFEPGTGLAVELARHDTDKVSTVFVKVVNVRRQEDGLWALGFEAGVWRGTTQSEDDAAGAFFRLLHDAIWPRR